MKHLNNKNNKKIINFRVFLKYKNNKKDRKENKLNEE
jgi:hypothetical protein